MSRLTRIPGLWTAGARDGEAGGAPDWNLSPAAGFELRSLACTPLRAADILRAAGNR